MKRPPSELASAINPDSVLIVNEALAQGDQADVRSEEESSLLALIDGKRTVAEILHQSRMSGFVAMRRLRALLERQVIRPAGRMAPVAPPAGNGNPKGGRLGLTQDLTSAAEAFAQARRDPVPPAATNTTAPAPEPPRAAPGMATAPGEERPTPLQGSVSLP
jgi:hypothetical protein